MGDEGMFTSASERLRTNEATEIHAKMFMSIFIEAKAEHALEP